MIIEESFTIDAPPGEVAAFLLDVERMSKCVPGVDGVQALEDNHYEANLSLRLGPIQARFAGSVHVDPSGAPDRLTATAKGSDRGTGSHAQVEFAASLVGLPDGATRVDSVSDVTIRGRLGQFGTGVITSTATSLIRDFAECAATAVAARLQDLSQPTSQTSPTLGRTLRRGTGIYLRSLFHRLGERVRRLISGIARRDR